MVTVTVRWGSWGSSHPTTTSKGRSPAPPPDGHGLYIAIFCKNTINPLRSPYSKLQDHTLYYLFCLFCLFSALPLYHLRTGPPFLHPPPSSPSSSTHHSAGKGGGLVSETVRNGKGWRLTKGGRTVNRERATKPNKNKQNKQNKTNKTNKTDDIMARRSYLVLQIAIW